MDRRVRDYDCHPDQETVRCLGIPEFGALINDDRTYVTQTRQPDAFHATPES